MRRPPARHELPAADSMPRRLMAQIARLGGPAAHAALLLWCRMAEEPDRCLPDNDRTLARIVGKPVERWQDIRRLIGHFLVVKDGRLTFAELEGSRLLHEIETSSGALGGVCRYVYELIGRIVVQRPGETAAQSVDRHNREVREQLLRAELLYAAKERWREAFHRFLGKAFVENVRPDAIRDARAWINDRLIAVAGRMRRPDLLGRVDRLTCDWLVAEVERGLAVSFVDLVAALFLGARYRSEWAARDGPPSAMTTG